jgi:hypothetical protein
MNRLQVANPNISWPNVRNSWLLAIVVSWPAIGDGDDMLGGCSKCRLADGRIVPADCGAVKHVGVAAQFIVRWVVR